MRRRAVVLVWNDRTRRPRLPWRLLAAAVVLALLALGTSVTTPYLLDAVATGLRLVVPGAVASVVARNAVLVSSLLVAYAGAAYLTGRFVDRRRFHDFGLDVDRGWWLDLGFGLVLGAALMTCVFLAELAAGWIVVTDTVRTARPGLSIGPWLVLVLVTFVGVGFTEELLARGYLLTNLAEGFTWFDRIGSNAAVGIAIVGSSLVFAGGHASNPSASLASTAGIAIASAMLASGYVLTGDLAIPIGVHVTWNFFQGPVYGFPVSGVDFGASLLSVTQRGDPMVTGGTFGPEAGALGVIASLVGTGLVVAWVYRHHGRVRIAPSVTRPDLRVEPNE